MPAPNNVYKALGEWWLNGNIMNINKRFSKLKVRYFKTPNASYTHRYLNILNLKRVVYCKLMAVFWNLCWRLAVGFFDFKSKTFSVFFNLKPCSLIFNVKIQKNII